jgi:hypothetical protein
LRKPLAARAPQTLNLPCNEFKEGDHPMKRCSKCGKTKPENEFSRRSPGCLRAQCKQCHCKRKTPRVESVPGMCFCRKCNRHKSLDFFYTYPTRPPCSPCKQCTIEAQIRYHARNKAHISEYRSAYYSRHKDRARVHAAKYRGKNAKLCNERSFLCHKKARANLSDPYIRWLIANPRNSNPLSGKIPKILIELKREELRHARLLKAQRTDHSQEVARRISLVSHADITRFFQLLSAGGAIAKCLET